MNEITIRDYEPETADFRAEFLYGLDQTPARVPCKFLYDDRGSELFDQICELEDYYPTRTEMGILEGNIAEIADQIGPRARIVEFGSGSGRKIKILLSHLEDPVSYVPIDISAPALRSCAEGVRETVPEIDITPICADYTEPFELPDPPETAESTVVFFPGSTIGNFDPERAVQFLGHIGEVCSDNGGLLIGVDRDKSSEILERAYDDREGVTADFNLNLLRRANRELGADFDLESFEHRAVYRDEESRIEMRLVATRDQTVHIDDQTFEFDEGDYIVTEHSNKYTPERFRACAEEAGLRPAGFWTDPEDLFSIWYLTPDRSGG